MELGGVGLFGGEHEDRDTARAHVHPDAPAHFVAANARQVVVDDDEIRHALVERFHRVLRRGRADDVAAFVLQHQLELQRLRDGVLDDENPARHDPSDRLGGGDQRENPRRDRFQRQALAGGAAVDGGFRHPVHDRRRFVLGHRVPARLTQLQQSVRAIVAHPREQDAEPASPRLRAIDWNSTVADGRCAEIGGS